MTRQLLHMLMWPVITLYNPCLLSHLTFLCHRHNDASLLGEANTGSSFGLLSPTYCELYL